MISYEACVWQVQKTQGDYIFLIWEREFSVLIPLENGGLGMAGGSGGRQKEGGVVQKAY